LSSRQSHRVIFKELVFPIWERRSIRQIPPGPSRLLPKNFRKNPLGRSDCPAGPLSAPESMHELHGAARRQPVSRRGSREYSRPLRPTTGRRRLSANFSPPYAPFARSPAGANACWHNLFRPWARLRAVSPSGGPRAPRGSQCPRPGRGRAPPPCRGGPYDQWRERRSRCPPRSSSRA